MRHIANSTKNKYHNHKITNQFGTFDSQAEFSRYIFLLNREKDGEISNLRRQVEYELIPPQYKTIIEHKKTKDKEVQKLVERECCYRADFVYERDGKEVVEDVKGGGDGRFTTETPDFKIKKKLLLWRYGIEIKIVTSPTFWDKNAK